MARRLIHVALAASALAALAASGAMAAEQATPAGAPPSVTAHPATHASTPHVSTPAAAPAPQASTEADAHSAALPSEALLREIADWLTANFGIKAVARPPQVAMVSAREALFLRYKAFTAEKQRQVLAQHAAGDGGELAGVYDPRSGTITLVEGWTGRSPAEVSVLVHEMVHHLQHQARMKFACPQESEALAYAAQEKWLQQHDLDLKRAFNLDPFTVMAMTLCAYWWAARAASLTRRPPSGHASPTPGKPSVSRIPRPAKPRVEKRRRRRYLSHRETLTGGSLPPGGSARFDHQPPEPLIRFARALRRAPAGMATEEA